MSSFRFYRTNQRIVSFVFLDVLAILLAIAAISISSAPNQGVPMSDTPPPSPVASFKVVPFGGSPTRQATVIRNGIAQPPSPFPAPPYAEFMGGGTVVRWARARHSQIWRDRLDEWKTWAASENPDIIWWMVLYNDGEENAQIRRKDVKEIEFLRNEIEDAVPGVPVFVSPGPVWQYEGNTCNVTEMESLKSFRVAAILTTAPTSNRFNIAGAGPSLSEILEEHTDDGCHQVRGPHGQELVAFGW